MHSSADTEHRPRLPAAALGLLAGAVALLMGAAVAVALLAPGPASCGEPVGSVKGVPRELAPIYVAAGERFGLGRRGPSILAAVNWVETGFGENLGPSSAGAEGWMQFLPSSWTAYGVDANGDGRKDPDDPWDAIFAAARLLRASGAPGNWHDALFSYNHAEWYVVKVERAARRFEAHSTAAVVALCAAGSPSAAILGRSIRLHRPRAFRALPERLWIGSGPPQEVDARIWPNAVWLLDTYELRVTAARESGHRTHGDGTALDMAPLPGRSWDATARRAALDLGWTRACGASGTAPVCPLVPAIQFVGYNGFPSHGDPVHEPRIPHLHVSWKSSAYGCPGLCEPRAWVAVFPWAR